jgi:hypothetical protein
MEDFDATFAPSEEVVSPEEFTNRKQELEFLWSLADKATRRTASSYAIIARKGMGKTALMQEFYRQLFTRQTKIEKLSKIEEWSRPAELPEGRRLWFFSRHGFDQQAAARLRELNIFHSDISGFNALCRAVKIGEVPVG